MERFYAIHNTPVFLGRQGENEVREIAFDLSHWLEAHGEGRVQLYARRSGEKTMYPVPIVWEGNCVIWTVTEGDVGIAGQTGECELSYEPEGREEALAKSETWSTYVLASMDGDVTEPPPGAQAWIDKLRFEVSGYQFITDTAAKSATEAAQSAGTAGSRASAAAKSAQQAALAAEETRGSADGAARSAAGAAASAGEAAQSAGASGERAQASAASAEQSEQAAQAAAVSEGAAKSAAENAAKSAEAAEQAKADTEELKTAVETAKDGAEKAAQAAGESAQQAAELLEEDKKAAAASAGAAETSAQEAGESASAAGKSAQEAAESAEAASEAQTGAEKARAAIENMLVEAIGLATGEAATVSKTLVDGVVKLVFGLPAGEKGDKGEPGVSVEKIERTEGTGAAGTTDTYTITKTDGSTHAFAVYNGKDGAKGAPGESATINGKAAVTIKAGENVDIEQDEDGTMTISASGGVGVYFMNFAAADWSDDVTITIPAATHGLKGRDVVAQASILSGGAYLKGTWATAETYALVQENGDIVLHGPSVGGFDGTVLLIG